MFGYDIPCFKVFAYRTKPQYLIEVHMSSVIHLPTSWSHTVCTTSGQRHTSPAVKGSSCRVPLGLVLLYAASYPDTRGRDYLLKSLHNLYTPVLHSAHSILIVPVCLPFSIVSSYGGFIHFSLSFQGIG